MGTWNNQSSRRPNPGGNRGRDNRGPQGEPYIGAPFGFVPLAEQVVEPEWLTPRPAASDGRRPEPPPVHDVPFRDGICGSLTVRIEAETPIFTRDARERERFFRLPDGRYAIPGTALKGALRNVVEIAGFGRMNRVNDHRYAVRDLQNPALYTRFMADLRYNPATGKNEPTPLVEAGWLQRVDEANGPEYRITPCDFAKIEYSPLEKLAQQRGVRGFDPGSRQSSVDKYGQWGSASLDVQVDVKVYRPRGQEFLTEFGLAEPRPGRPGRLVFTGQPSPYRKNTHGGRRRGNAKHHDFVFLEDCGYPPVTVPDRVFRDFEFAHSDRGQQNNLGLSETPNKEWGFWKKKFDEGGRVPVFFLREKDTKALKAFGLAMMFRLPYRYSIHDAVRNVQPNAFDSPHGIDLASGLFGTVPFRDQNDSGPMLRGRVSVGHAVAQGSPREEDKPRKVILGQPSASYYPLYVEQTHTRPNDRKVPFQRVRSNPKPDYRTWQDDNVRLGGWKRYRPLTRVYIPDPPTNARGESNTDRVATTFTPLRAGTEFETTLAVHNLRPMELGALIWALDFGGNASARHMLGYARPLGFGRCRIAIADAELTSIGGASVQLDACRDAFVAWMEEKCSGGWATSPQIRELVALAQPVDPEKARYQRLDPGARVNEFVDAKKAGLKLPATRDASGEEPIDSSSPRSSGDSPHSAARGPAQRGQRAAPAPQTLPPPLEAERPNVAQTPESRADNARIAASTLRPNTAATEIPERLATMTSDDEKRAYLEAAAKELGAKWLKKKVDKAWMKELLPEFERLGFKI